MALSDPDLSVKIREETFSLLVIPKAESELVKKAKTTLLGELDLESLVADLDQLGKFIGIAYNGVAGNTYLRMKVRRVSDKIAELTDELAATVDKFKQTSDSLQELQGVYQFLLEGLEEMALEKLALLVNVAEDMAKAAEELQKKFEDATTDVIDALEDIQRTEATIQQCTGLVMKMMNCKDNEGLVQVAIEALYHSKKALKSLSAMMMNAQAQFLHQMQEHCESLAKKDVQKVVEHAMKYPEEKRLKVWTSNGFKTKVIIYYSHWVALDDVCGTYVEQIKKTRQDRYRYLQENPTIEESRKIARQLVASLEKAYEEIAAKRLEGKPRDGSS